MLACSLGAIVLIDLPIHRALQAAPDWLVGAFQAVTWTGDSAFTLVPLGLAGLVTAAAWAGLRGTPGAGGAAVAGHAIGFLFVAIAGSGVLVNVIKQGVGRSRPVLLDLLDLHGFQPFVFDYAFQSFPSGHANTVFAAAVGLGILVPRLRWLFLAAAAVFATSRVVIGAHYVGDIIAGGALGYATTLWLRDRMASLGWVFARRSDGRIGLAPEAQALITGVPPAPASSRLTGRRAQRM